jgi:hypothetical protein
MITRSYALAGLDPHEVDVKVILMARELQALAIG